MANALMQTAASHGSNPGGSGGSQVDEIVNDPSKGAEFGRLIGNLPYDHPVTEQLVKQEIPLKKGLFAAGANW